MGLDPKPFFGFSLNELIGNGQAAVAVVMHDFNGTAAENKELFRLGFWPGNRYDYASTQPECIYRLPDSLDPFHIATTPSNKYSILDIVQRHQQEQFPLLLQKVVLALGHTTHVIADCIQGPDLLTLCLAISYLKFTGSGGWNKTRKIVVYGGVLVTKPQVYELMQKSINDAHPYHVTNDTMGEDTWGLMPKSCAVFYWDKDIVKGRWAREGEHLHFEQDVIVIRYGPPGQLAEVRDHGAYYRVLTAIEKKEPLLISNHVLGKPADAQPGPLKSCEIGFRVKGGAPSDIRWARAKEGEHMDFEKYSAS